jgi:lipase chaperone LimK
MSGSRQVLLIGVVLAGAVASGLWWSGDTPPPIAGRPAPPSVPPPQPAKAKHPAAPAIAEVRTRPTPRPSEPPPVPSAAPRSRTSTVSASDERIDHLPTLGPMPASLQGTAVDGDLILDETGHFVPTPEAIALFDYFLSAQGEESIEDIYDRILTEIRKRLPPEAASEAVHLLDEYLGFRQKAAEQLQRAYRVVRAPEYALRGIQQLRRAIFGPELAQRLFGGQEQEENAAIEQFKSGPRPPAAEAFDSARVSVESTAPKRYSPQEIVAVLTIVDSDGIWLNPTKLAKIQEMIGPEAMDRLVRLRNDRLVWQQRLDQYRFERQQIESTPGLDRAERQREIDELRAEHFGPDELPQVELLDRLGPRAPRPTP